MEFLHALESIRTPVLNLLLSAITLLGDETVFMLLGLTVFWCVSKRQGYYIFAVGLGGTVANQWLKLACHIPRPWVLDPNFTIVESARAAAKGYSFPSGHTQNIVGTMGCLMMANRQIWLRAACGACIVLVPFSRMYLGVHTPLDVGVAFALSVVLVILLWPCFRDDGRMRRSVPVIMPAVAAFALAYVCYATSLDPAGLEPVNLSNGIKNGWTLLGCALGLIATWLFDEKKLHFDEKAPLLIQILKVSLGAVLLALIRAGLKPVFLALFGPAAWTDALRYFLVIAFTGCVWPMTFPLLCKLGGGTHTG